MLSAFGKPLRSLIRRSGFDVVKIGAGQKPRPDSSLAFVDLHEETRRSAFIPGMISDAAGELLYALCASQTLRGDVVEIGSWLGKSTSFLGRAIAHSANGHLFAIDHFRGNVGREDSYRFRSEDLNDLRPSFDAHIHALALDRTVTCLQGSSAEVYPALREKTVRLLFIDGDHSEQGVRSDIELFAPLVPAGGLVVFDDFDASFPGLIRAVEAWAAVRVPSRMWWYHGLLVCQL